MVIQDDRDIKQTHEKNQNLEAKIKKVATVLRAEKQRMNQCQNDGIKYYPLELINEKIQTKNASIQAEIDDLKQKERELKKKHKLDLVHEAVKFQKSKQENDIMQIRFKEKDQELKLSNLKITELKKTMAPIKRIRNFDTESQNRELSEMTIQTEFKKSIPNKFLADNKELQQLYTFRQKQSRQSATPKGDDNPF